MDSDTPRFLTLAQAMHRSRYSVREVGILTSFHGFPLPAEYFHRTQPYYDSAQVEAWRRERERRLHQLLI